MNEVLDIDAKGHDNRFTDIQTGQEKTPKFVAAQDQNTIQIFLDDRVRMCAKDAKLQEDTKYHPHIIETLEIITRFYILADMELLWATQVREERGGGHC